MSASAPDTDQLLKRLAEGDAKAAGALLDRHRQRLKRMVSCRIDPRLAARVSPSDVVQETMMTAAKDLESFAKTRPMPFYPWLRRLAWNRLMDLQRRHLYRKKRAVGREEQMAPVTDKSLFELARHLVAGGPSPSRAAQQRELRDRLKAALETLEETQREVLLLKYVEGLTLAEAAAVLEISVDAAKMRHLRAVQRLRTVLADLADEH
jgi:RNA polymerase sigma-70 factor (ECF subfamily)